jgi:hypothetical protein
VVDLSGCDSLLVGWVVVGPTVEVEFGMGGFAIHSVAQSHLICKYLACK